MSASRPVVALCFLNYGPYHVARFRRARQALPQYDLRAVQMAAIQEEYSWPASDGEGLVTVESHEPLHQAPAAAWRRRIARPFEGLAPDCCAAAGYGHPSMRAAIEWCRRRGRPVVLMSDSTAEDAPRAAWKEWIKSRIVDSCSAGFVAGKRHAEYLAGLGMPRARISLGYDVVDNDYFARGAVEARSAAHDWRARLAVPWRYFLASARFVEKKNLLRLLRAYARYCAAWAAEPQVDAPWDLVLLGDGPLRAELEALREQLGLAARVHMPGFRQYAELPRYYSLAQALILASTVDQWGLVVNEAMASGLPVLVSERCGCAAALVRNGENGFTFDPWDEVMIANQMLRMSRLSPPERTCMGRRSEELVAEFGLDRFAEGLGAALTIALESDPPRRRPFGSLALRALTIAAR